MKIKLYVLALLGFGLSLLLGPSGCGRLSLSDSSILGSGSLAGNPSASTGTESDIHIVSANYTFGLMDPSDLYPLALNSSITLSIIASHDLGLAMTYAWTCSGNGTLTEISPTEVIWTVPSIEGVYYPRVTVSDGGTSNPNYYDFGPFCVFDSSDTTAPGDASGVTYDNEGAYLAISWQAASGAAMYEIAYYDEYGSNVSKDTILNSYSLSTWTPGTSFRVTAKDYAGNRSSQISVLLPSANEAATVMVQAFALNGITYAANSSSSTANVSGDTVLSLILNNTSNVTKVEAYIHGTDVQAELNAANNYAMAFNVDNFPSGSYYVYLDSYDTLGQVTGSQEYLYFNLSPGLGGSDYVNSTNLSVTLYCIAAQYSGNTLRAFGLEQYTTNFRYLSLAKNASLSRLATPNQVILSHPSAGTVDLPYSGGTYYSPGASSHYSTFEYDLDTVAVAQYIENLASSAYTTANLIIIGDSYRDTYDISIYPEIQGSFGAVSMNVTTVNVGGAVSASWTYSGGDDVMYFVALQNIDGVNSQLYFYGNPLTSPQATFNAPVVPGRYIVAIYPLNAYMYNNASNSVQYYYSNRVPDLLVVQ